MDHHHLTVKRVRPLVDPFWPQSSRSLFKHHPFLKLESNKVMEHDTENITRWVKCTVHHKYLLCGGINTIYIMKFEKNLRILRVFLKFVTMHFNGMYSTNKPHTVSSNNFYYNSFFF
jgi:hypothetical protein